MAEETHRWALKVESVDHQETLDTLFTQPIAQSAISRPTHWLLAAGRRGAHASLANKRMAGVHGNASRALLVSVSASVSRRCEFTRRLETLDRLFRCGWCWHFKTEPCPGPQRYNHRLAIKPATSRSGRGNATVPSSSQPRRPLNRSGGCIDYVIAGCLLGRATWLG